MTTQQQEQLHNIPAARKLSDASSNMLGIAEGGDTALAPKARVAAPLEALPEEIARNIYAHLDDRVDLYHFSLVNRNAYSFTTGLLYKKYDLVLASEMEEHSAQILSDHNVGREFIRELKVSLDVDYDMDPGGAYQFLGPLLDRSPLHNLTRFETTSHRPLPVQIIKKLWETQKNLQYLELLPSAAIDDHYVQTDEDTHTAIIDLLKRACLDELKSIRVVPDGTGTAALCSIAMQKGQSQALTTLEVDSRDWADVDDCEHADHGVAFQDQLVESPFSHVPRVLPSHRGRLDSLTTLVLRDVNLVCSKYTWYTYLNLIELKHLELHHCEGADAFLLELTGGDKIPALKSFTMIHNVGERPDRSLEAFEQVMQDIGYGIRDLHLCLRNAPRMPKRTAIARYGNTLRHLSLDVQSSLGHWNTPSGPLVYSQTDFNAMVEACTRIQQLCITFPDIRLEYYRLSASAPAFDLYAKTVAKLRDLKVLSLINLSTDYVGHAPPGYLEAKYMALAGLSPDIFKIYRSAATDPQLSTLKVLAFGSRERDDNCRGPRYFLAVVGQALCRIRHGAAHVSFTELQEEGLVTGVLAYERRDFYAESRKVFHPVDKEEQ